MEQQIDPHKVTKPIQLLAAWLLGLVLVDSSFLSAAYVLKEPTWASSFLVIAAVLNVPLFLGSLFLLQTKFRPEMQEDVYYSKYLEIQRTTGKPEGVATDIQLLRANFVETNVRTLSVVEQIQTQIMQLAKSAPTFGIVSTNSKLLAAKVENEWGPYRIDVNDLLPQYKAIRANLKKAGLQVADIFGSSSSVPLPPDHYVVTFGHDLDMSLVKEVLRTVSSTGPGFLSVTGEKELMHANRVYIGAYGYEVSPLLKLSSSLLETIMKLNCIQEVKELIVQNPTRLNPKVLQRPMEE
jgi:hypothetical protein